MNKKKELNRLLLFGILAEVLILLFSWIITGEIKETFRLSARYSGRLSLFFFTGLFILSTINWNIRRTEFKEIFVGLTGIFAILHFIHFGFLAANVYINQVDLIPFKLAGGFLGYLLILVYPYWLKSGKPPKWMDSIYFFYLSLIFIVTLLSRISGSFPGSEPSKLHYFAFTLIALALLFHLRKILIREK